MKIAKVPVVAYNTDEATFEFVIACLSSVAGMSRPQAMAKTDEINNTEMGVPVFIGEYLPEIAETIVDEIAGFNELNNFKFQVEVQSVNG